MVSWQAIPPSRSTLLTARTPERLNKANPDHLVGRLVHRDALQLGQGNRKASAFPADQDEQLVLALLLGAIPTTSTSSPTRRGEMLRWVMHLATSGKCSRSSRE
jgi:hypothetical protein